jgi:16S rRNA (adenine(1408)-N(1))-methyltransferase
MARASRRAARPAKRGGLANALFVVAAAEALPAELDGVTDALTVHFPWGSLLRGLLTADAAILGGIARVTRPGAAVTLLLSLTERDNVTEIGTIDERTFAVLAPAYATHGLTLLDARIATREELAGSHSSWAKRLRAGRSRRAWQASFRRRHAEQGKDEGPRR